MIIRNPRFNALGTIDCELKHPEFGWIPFTASPADAEAHGRELHASLIEGRFGDIEAYQPTVTTQDLCHSIDVAADRARAAVAGDPLRAVEYDRARIEAEQFTANGYQGDVPPMVAAWAINGRTAAQAATDILHEAAQYSAALVQLRTTRLAAKEQIRALMAADQVDQAQQLTEQTIAAIEAAIHGVGNAGR